MKNITRKTREFFRALHEDESGPGTVEWVLMVIVALIIMAVIYFIAQWVIKGGAEEAEKVNTERDSSNKAADDLKGTLGL